MGVLDGRSAARKDDLARPSLPRHAHDFSARGAADDGVVDEADNTPGELRLQRAQLSPDALLPRLLAGQDECPVHVAVLDEAVGEGLAEALRHDGRRRVAGLRDRDNNVNLLDTLLTEHLLELVRQLGPHALPAAVDRDAVHYCVRPGKVHVLKDVGGVALCLGDLAEFGLAALLDEDGLAWQDVLEVLEAELTEGNALGCQHVVGAALDGGRRAASHHKRADSVGVTEGQDAKPGNHGRGGPRSLASLVCLGHGAEDVVDVDTGLARIVEGVGKDIEHQLAVRVRVDMTMGFFVEVAAQLGGVDQVAVVGKA